MSVFYILHIKHICCICAHLLEENRRQKGEEKLKERQREKFCEMNMKRE